MMWDKCGMARNADGLREAIARIPAIREEFWQNVFIPGSGDNMNQELEKAGRVADFLEFGELMCHDALDREESCGGHFREEHQSTENDPEVQSGLVSPGEAKRNDEDYAYVSAWEFKGVEQKPVLHKEWLNFEFLKPSTRSYK